MEDSPVKCRRASTFLPHRAALPLVGILTALATGCGGSSSPGETPVDPATREATSFAAQRTIPDTLVGDLLGRLRAATARFQRLEAADSSGYNAQLTGCMSDPELGGMGVHFGKASAIDAALNPVEPEVLLYEPEPNGRYRLVAVEFVVPYSVQPRNGPAPTLFGREFVPFDDFDLWGLHVWVWSENPAGMFADWNPRVVCDAAPSAAHSSHTKH
jgi:hypothetical protein